jgi:hypothetical protein
MMISRTSSARAGLARRAFALGTDKGRQGVTPGAAPGPGEADAASQVAGSALAGMSPGVPAPAQHPGDYVHAMWAPGGRRGRPGGAIGCAPPRGGRARASRRPPAGLSRRARRSRRRRAARRASAPAPWRRAAPGRRRTGCRRAAPRRCRPARPARRRARRWSCRPGASRSSPPAGRASRARQSGTCEPPPRGRGRGGARAARRPRAARARPPPFRMARREGPSHRCAVAAGGPPRRHSLLQH